MAANKKKIQLRTVTILAIILLTCGHCQSQRIKQLFSGTDKFISAQDYQDSTIFRYEDYEITVFPNRPSVGEDIRIKDSTNQIRFIYNDWASYFAGLIDNKLIINAGTGTVRRLKVYDLSNLEIIFSSSFKRSIEVNEGIINFYAIVKLSEEESSKIDCPEREELIRQGLSVGYLEKQEFNTKSGELYKSGIIKCQYFE